MMKKITALILSLTFILSAFTVFASAGTDYKPFENSEYFTCGDYDIHYRVFPAQGEQKGRIMMLHGFMCSTYAWRNMADGFTKAGYECVCADLPDFGYSTRENADTDVIGREELIIALMEYLAPGEEWILAGHSMGGGVAVNIAQRISLKALLLYCPCPQSEFPAFAEKIVKSGAMETAMNLFFKYGTKITPLVRLVIYAATNDWKFAMNYDVTGVTAPVQYDGFGAGMCEMMYNVIPTDLENTDKIGCPVLVCNATNDIILNGTQKAQITDAFPGATYYTVEGGGHQCIENRADELCNISIEFLN